MRLKTKTCNKKTYWLLLAAVSSLPLLASQAMAQQQVQNQGHANDANNRVGSGGYNNSILSQQASGNQIVNGEVTGGFGFQGSVPYFGPNDFHELLPGSGVDAFIANSGGPQSSPGYLGMKGAVPVYNAAQTATPPPGYVLGATGGNYVAAAPYVPGAEDTNLNSPISTLMIPLPKPGELTMPGQVDPTAGVSLFSQQSQIYALTPSNVQPGSAAGAGLFAPANPGQQLSQDRILEIRRELNQNLTVTPQTPILNPNLAGTPNNNTANANNGNTTGMGANTAANGGPITGAILSLPSPDSGPLSPTADTGAEQVNPLKVSPTAGDVSTDQSNRSYISLETLPAPAKQSSTYAELQRRLEAYDNSHPMTDEEANREFRALVEQRERVLNGTASPGGLPGATGGGLGGASGLPTGVAGGAGTGAGAGAAPQIAPPVQVDSIAAGIKSKALADMLSQAEDLMQHQQFGKAMEIYTQAIQADPNNPLLLIGRANAELGGSYYRAAETDLRTAFQSDKAVLMGQYDLNKTLGDERLQYIVAQLKQIATDSKDNPTPLFLLAYVSYNTHNEAKASDYLDEAAARTPAGITDDVIPLLKKYWTFTPQTGGTTQPADLNK